MKLLVIEDELELCRSIVSYLKSESYSCEVAHTYGGAIENIGGLLTCQASAEATGMNSGSSCI